MAKLLAKNETAIALAVDGGYEVMGEALRARLLRLGRNVGKFALAAPGKIF